jgi:hypothetical protein
VKLLDPLAGKVYLTVSYDPISIPNFPEIANTANCCGYSRVWLLCPLIHRKSRINRAQCENNTPTHCGGIGNSGVVMADIKCWSDWFHDTKHLIASEGRVQRKHQLRSSLRALAELWEKTR